MFRLLELGAPPVWHDYCSLSSKRRQRMLKISIVENPYQRRLVMEGKLIARWAAELRAEHLKSEEELDGRELVIDVRHLSAISQEGENVLLELMNSGVKFRCCGVFNRHVLKDLTRRARRNLQEVTR